MDSTDMKIKVLKMYVAEYDWLDLLDHRQLLEILKLVYRTLKYNPKQNFIFYGYIRPKVLKILEDNGFVRTSLTFADVHLKTKVIMW